MAPPPSTTALLQPGYTAGPWTQWDGGRRSVSVGYKVTTCGKYGLLQKNTRKPFSYWQHSFHMKAVLPLVKRFATASHRYDNEVKLHLIYQTKWQQQCNTWTLQIGTYRTVRSHQCVTYFQLSCISTWTMIYERLRWLKSYKLWRSFQHITLGAKIIVMYLN